MIVCEQYKVRCFSVYGSSHPTIVYCLLGSDTLLTTLFSNIFNLDSFLKLRQNFTCMLTGYCYGVLSCKASHVLQPFSDLLCPHLRYHPDSSTRALWLQQRLLVGKQDVVCLSYSTGIFNMPQKLTTWGQWLYFPSEVRRAADLSHL
jgi:hypothetical protein